MWMIITNEQVADAIKDELTPVQSALIERLLCECSPRATAAALDFIGKNGCGYHGTNKLETRTSELNAIAEFIARCYERFPADHPEGAAIRAAIKAAITENDKKDAQ